MNLPHELIPPLHKTMKEDIEWSCSTPECPPDERPYYGFTHFIGVARCFGGDAGTSSSSSAVAAPVGKKKKKRRTAAVDNAEAPEGGLVYAHVEDELYMSKASFSFTFPMPVKAERERKVRGAGSK